MDLDLLKRMLKYSYPIVFIGLAGMINETFDRILIKSLMPDSQSDYQVSIYSAFYKLSMVLTLFVQAFRFAVEPYFFEQAKQLNPQESYAYVMKWFVYVVAIIYLGTLLILPYIAPILIQNPAYFDHPDGMKIVPYLLAANLFLGLYYTLSVWYKVSEKTHIGAIPAFTGAAITLIKLLANSQTWHTRSCHYHPNNLFLHGCYGLYPIAQILPHSLQPATNPYYPNPNLLIGICPIERPIGIHRKFFDIHRISIIPLFIRNPHPTCNALK
jgi:hypothetical protein